MPQWPQKFISFQNFLPRGHKIFCFIRLPISSHRRKIIKVSFLINKTEIYVACLVLRMKLIFTTTTIRMVEIYLMATEINHWEVHLYKILKKNFINFLWNS